LNIEVNKQPKTVWLAIGSKWAGVVGHVISVGKYEFSIVVIDYVIRVSELTSGGLLFTVTLEGDTLAMTETEERALLFYEAVIGTSIVEVINKFGDSVFGERIEEHKKIAYESLGEMPPIEDYDISSLS